MSVEETPIAETEDHADGEPMLLIVPYNSAADNTLRLLDRLRSDYGYEVEVEHHGEAQAVYTVAPEGTA